MSTNDYTLTTACSDSLSIAMQSVGLAIRLAQAAGIPVQHRLEEIHHDMHSICDDLGHLHRQENRAAAQAVVQATPGIPIPIANMLVNLHPQERIALDMATRHGKLNPEKDNDRLACESLFRKGVFKFDVDNNFVIDQKYAPWIKRAPTPHEILAGLSPDDRDLVRMIAERKGKLQPASPLTRDQCDKLRQAGVLVNDGATDKFRLADPFADIAG